MGTYAHQAEVNETVYYLQLPEEIMTHWILRPLHLGNIRRDKSVFTYMKNMGTQIDFPVIAWYIEGGGHRVLVDTGGHDPAEGQGHQPYFREPAQDLIARLSALGVRPEEIDLLILTHLHWDHACNIHLFPKARVFVQREELRYAAAPLPPHRIIYDNHPSLPLTSDRYEILEGDSEIIDGISVHLLPGHTPGIQGVLVRSAEAAYLIAGDNVPLLENWKAAEKYGVSHWPNSIHVDLEACFRSFRKMEGLGGEVLPSHDWSVLKKSEYR